MPCSCTDVPTRVQPWKRPISSPCPWLSGQWKISPCTVLFCVLSSPNCLSLLNFCPSHMALCCRKQGQDCPSWFFLWGLQFRRVKGMNFIQVSLESCVCSVTVTQQVPQTLAHKAQPLKNISGKQHNLLKRCAL